MSNIPYFEVNGKRYEIKRTRYLMAELDALRGEIEFTEEEEVRYTKEQQMSETLAKLAERKEELYEKFLETFDEKDEEMYNRARSAYDRMLDEFGSMGNVSGEKNKKMLDMAEKLIIRSLQLNEKGEEIRSAEEANDIWCSYVDEVGKVSAIQFVAYTSNYIVGNDEGDENPFVTQAKAKAEQRAQKRREGMRKVR